MDVLVFITSVYNRRAVSKVRPLLAALPAIAQWNFDLDDCDHILRIESNGLHPQEIESLLQIAGFDCRELEY